MLSKRTVLVDVHGVSYLGLVLVRESPTIPPLENAKMNSSFAHGEKTASNLLF